MIKILRDSLVVVFLISIIGCGASTSQVNSRLKNLKLSDRPQQITILPADIEIHRFTAGGAIEEVPEWTEESKGAFKTAVVRHIEKRSNLVLRELPELTAEEQLMLDEHIALYGVVGPAAVSEGAIWKHKSENFDYSIGPGLAFLKEKSGSSNALFINAVDLRSTGGRAALAVGAAIFGVGIPMGGSRVYVSMVDLETGDILWTYTGGAPGSFTDPTKMELFLQKTIDDYLAVYDKDGRKVAKANR